MLTGDHDGAERFFCRVLDDHLVVIDLWQQELRVLNPSAATLWLSLSLASQTIQDLVALVVGDVDTATSDRAYTDVAACLAEWRELGWLRQDADGRLQLADRGQAPDRVNIAIPVSPDDPLAALLPTIALERHAIRLLNGDANIDLGEVTDPCAHDLVPRLRAVLSGFPTPPADSEAVTAHLRFIVGHDRIWIDTPEGLVWTTDSSDALSHMVYSLFLAADPGRRPLATLHAAAVGRPGRGLLLLPGESGSGKSTLTAGLVARGWSYAGDDVLALTDSNPATILPFPTAASVKPGSWDLVAQDYQQIWSFPVTPYIGKTARFLPLPVSRHVGSVPADRMPQAIVFPTYDPAGRGQLVPMTTLDAVLRLVVCGFTTGDRFETIRLDPLFDLLERLPKYQLTFDGVASAEAALAPLLA